MIDIHTHVLPFVDDGSESLSKSLEMVKTASENGITDLFLTPHHSERTKTPKEIIEVFNKFKKEVENLNIPINLYLGNEIFYETNTIERIKENKCLTMNGGKFVLIEFSTYHPIDVEEASYKLIRAGYVPIIAHVERYSYLTPENYHELKNMGALLQINAEAIVGKLKRKRQNAVKYLFKHELVDFVSSDVHSDRPNLMQEAFRAVQKKYGEFAAQVVFNLKAKEIIKG